MKISISLNHRVTLLTVIVLPILFALGNWQLNRADEKREIQEKRNLRQAQAPATIESLDTNSDLAFTPVKLRGVFDNQHNYLLDNRINSGKVGYDVLSPFLTTTGTWVLVNRGWIVAPPLRSDKPVIPPALASVGAMSGEIFSGQALPGETGQIARTEKTNTISVLASVYVSPGKPFQLEEQKFENIDWPLVIQVVEAEKLGALLNRDFFQYELRLKTNEIGALKAEWQAINVQPEKHIAYAVQWFAMAAVLAIWFLFANTNLKLLFANKKEN